MEVILKDKERLVKVALEDIEYIYPIKDGNKEFTGIKEKGKKEFVADEDIYEVFDLMFQELLDKVRLEKPKE